MSQGTPYSPHPQLLVDSNMTSEQPSQASDVQYPIVASSSLQEQLASPQELYLTGPGPNSFSSTPHAITTDQTLLSFDVDECLQLDDAFWSTSWTITDASAQSPVGRLPVVHLEAVEDNPVVGSPQVQQAAGKRHKKCAILECPYRKAGCLATFAARHNLRYHLNSHLAQKPYKCRKCSYAAVSPATMKRHQTSCRVTVQSST